MFFVLLAALNLVSASTYMVGDTFSYNYTSHVETNALSDDESNSAINYDITCNATFKVISNVADGTYMSLTVANVTGFIESKGEDNQYHKNELDAGEATDDWMSYPLYFKLKKDGSITDVIASKDDGEDVVSVKTSIAFALRTNLNAVESEDYIPSTVIDPLGKHVEYSSVEKGESESTIKTFYSENDFLGYADPQTDETAVTIDSQTTHVVSDNKVMSSTSTTTAVLNRADASARLNEEDDGIQFIVTGISSVSDYRSHPSNMVSDAEAVTSVSQFLKKNKRYALVPSLRSAYYLNTPAKTTTQKPVAAATTTCGGNIDVCKTYDKSWTAGNSKVGLRLSVKATAGITSGCSQASRSYLVAAYANLDILIVGKSVSALDAGVEYGQVNGVAQRNTVYLKLFGNSVYNKQIPSKDCTSKTFHLLDINKSWRFPYSVQVYCVTISFYIEIGISLTADCVVTICPNALKGDVNINPRAALSLAGGAEASVHVAKAGVAITGSGADRINPQVYADGNICRIGFRAINYFEGVTAKIQGYYQLRTVKKWFKVSWGSKHSVTLWSHSWGAKTETLVDIYWGAK